MGHSDTCFENMQTIINNWCQITKRRHSVDFCAWCGARVCRHFRSQENWNVCLFAKIGFDNYENWRGIPWGKLRMLLDCPKLADRRNSDTPAGVDRTNKFRSGCYPSCERGRPCRQGAGNFGLGKCAWDASQYMAWCGIFLFMGSRAASWEVFAPLFFPRRRTPPLFESCCAPPSRADSSSVLGNVTLDSQNTSVRILFHYPPDAILRPKLFLWFVGK